MSPPPETRTAAFLMTDIAGSTRLWEAQPDAMAVALAAHDAILREAVERAGGEVIKTTGDGMLAAFDRPTSAVEACVAGQRALLAHDWPATAPLSVRMAIHVGAAEARDGDYFGPALNRVARLLAIGHGGQILVSSAGAAVLADELRADVELLDRGEHRLKDLSRLEHVWQLVAPGLPSEFPPLRSGRAPTNLPAELTSFVGREREMAAVNELASGHRLVSLVGVGGTGKTRLMLHVAGELAGRHADGTWLVELAPLRDPDLVIAEVATTLGIPDAPGQPLLATVTDFLRDKDLLLLLDNCEHLIGAAADLVERLLESCRLLHVMTTSREALGIPGEATFAVPSLGVPELVDHPDVETAAATEAVQLFVERAGATSPAFRLDATNIRAVVEICRRLDGIPLALELAAARINVLSAEEIARGLGDRFRLLTGGRRTAVPRQQTLQALIDWSWDLLTEADQRLLRRLSVFAGGWTLESACEVTRDQPEDGPPPQSAIDRLETLDGLGRLVDRSLVAAEHHGSTRYEMLETIRQYAGERLAISGEANRLRDRHLRYFCRLASEADSALRGREMVAWLERLDAEIDNIRVALDWAFEADPEAGLEMAASLELYWQTRSVGSEGVDRLALAIETMRTLPEPTAAERNGRLRLASRVLAAAAGVAATSNRHTNAARDWADQAVTLARECGDGPALVRALGARFRAAIFIGTGLTDDFIASSVEMVTVAEEMGDALYVALGAASIGMSQVESDPASSDARLRQATEAARRSQNPFATGFAALINGRILGHQHRLDEARPWFTESISAFRELGDRRMELAARSDFAHALRRGGLLEPAEVEYRRTILEWQNLGQRAAVANQLEAFAFLAAEREATERAAVLLGAAARLRELASAPMLPDEQVDYETEVRRVRDSLEPAAFEQAWTRGRGLSMEDAVSLAIEG